MAMTQAKVSDEAESFQIVAEAFLNAYEKIVAIINHDNDLAIDWAGATKPAYVDEDPSGNIAGLRFTRKEVADAKAALNAIKATMNAANIKALNMLARPTGKR